MHQPLGLPGTILNTWAELSWPGKCHRASGATGVPWRMQWVLINNNADAIENSETGKSKRV